MSSSPPNRWSSASTSSPPIFWKRVTDLGLEQAPPPLCHPRRTTLSDKAAQLETGRSRLAAQTSLIEFACALNPRYRPAPHHILIARHLEAVGRGEIDRLMIFMPPRHGKSELASRKFPAWYLGRHPERQVLAASHSAQLATSFGRHVRNLMASEEFAGIFPGVGLCPDSRAAHRMNTPQGGVYVAAGVATAITGLGADLLLIDDPVRGREEADSALRRQAVDEWYRSDAFTRLMPGGAIVLIQTRWHEDDLAGRLLARNSSLSRSDGEGDQPKPEAKAGGGAILPVAGGDGEGDRAKRGGGAGGDPSKPIGGAGGAFAKHGEWTVLDLPAISASGEALWPERFDLPRLDRIKQEIGPRAWSALYQQRPQPEQGSFFRREDLVEWKVRPERLDIYGSSDYAVKEDDGDYTVHQVWGVDSEGILYRLECWRGQTRTDVWIDKKLNLIQRWRPLIWFGEGGSIQLAVEPALKRRMSERGIYCRLDWLTSIHDKKARAVGFQSRASMGRVRFEPGADLSEYLAFPTGKYDDEVDASSLIGRALDQLHPALGAKSAGPPRTTQQEVAEARERRWNRLFAEGHPIPDAWKTY